jgi:hypothetical protein
MKKMGDQDMEEFDKMAFDELEDSPSPKETQLSKSQRAEISKWKGTGLEEAVYEEYTKPAMISGAQYPKSQPLFKKTTGGQYYTLDGAIQYDQPSKYTNNSSRKYDGGLSSNIRQSAREKTSKDYWKNRVSSLSRYFTI